VWLHRDWYRHAQSSVVGHDRIQQFISSTVSSQDQVSHGSCHTSCLSIRLSACHSVRLPVCVFVCMSVCLSVYRGGSSLIGHDRIQQFITSTVSSEDQVSHSYSHTSYLSVSVSVCLFVCLSVCMCVCLSVRPSVCLSVCLSWWKFTRRTWLYSAVY